MAATFPRVVLPIATWLLSCAAGSAQSAPCASSWISCGGQVGIVSGSGPAGAETGVLASIRWDPDGAGPAPERAVFGGSFTSAGGVLANNIAQRDLTSGAWSPLGSGIAGIVRALAVLPNGELVAGGSFHLAGGVSLQNLARWNGSSWAPVDANGIGGTVRALAVRPNGSLIVVGGLAGPGFQYFGAAEWNGVSWAWHAGYSWTRDPYCVQLLPNGDLLAGTSGINNAEVVRWNGTAWNQVGATFEGYGPISPPWIMNRPCHIRDLDVLPNGDLLAAGSFSIGVAGSTHCLARWNGTAWSPVGAAGFVLAMRVEPSGQAVLAGGFQTTANPNAAPVQVWNGASMSPLGAGLTGQATSLLPLPTGELLVAGDLQSGASSLMAWNGAAWSSWLPIQPATDIEVRAIGLLAGGGFAIAGRSLIGGFVSLRLGNMWQPIPGLPANPFNLPTSLLELANSDLLVGGTFPGALVRWNGATWTGVGYPGAAVQGLVRAPNGDVIVAGDGAVWRFDGATWTQLGGSFAGGSAAAVFALAVAPNGDVYAGGDFTSIGTVAANRVARWDGVSWSALGNGIVGTSGSHVRCLAFTSGGELIAGGTFQVATGAVANKIARWNGSAWSAFGNTSAPFDAEVRAIVELPGGDLAIGGAFPWFGGGTGANLGRWNGNTWLPIGSGFSGQFSADVNALAVLPDGELAVGGDFTTANGLGTAKVVLVGTTCPANIVAGAAGCAGSGGANTLVATTLPWAGSTFRAQAGGMPALGLFAAVTGFAPLALPLSAVLPQGLPGCSLLASPDYLAVGLPSGGAAATALPIPDTLALAGVVFHHQVVAFETNAGGAIVALSSTPSLVATVGVY